VLALKIRVCPEFFKPGKAAASPLRTPLMTDESPVDLFTAPNPHLRIASELQNQL